MKTVMIFTDGSVDTRSNVGYGARLYVSESEKDQPISALKACVDVKRFDRTSSTALELQTVLWALKNIPVTECHVVVYTDSQNIIGLEARRKKIIMNDYRSNKGKPLANARLYQEFFTVIDTLSCEFVKVRGHQVSSTKDRIHKLFTLVDRASRRALRKVGS